ncbi:hypothetical protein TNCV_5001681 [Trichonephila clavipes]|nr:hypothetical protein TNCV_5001681 [Trichonephila clavipes]
MLKRKRGLTTDEIQKVLADLEDEIFDDSDSDCELENEEDDLISAQQKINRNYVNQALLQDCPLLLSERYSENENNPLPGTDIVLDFER